MRKVEENEGFSVINFVRNFVEGVGVGELILILWVKLC